MIPVFMSSSPKVSIGIPSYNHARFLPATIESVLAQTYPGVELVIVDDGSPDDSFRIAEAYAARHPSRVKVYTHTGRRNMGISATVNLCLEKSSGTYYIGLPSDDVLYPDAVERQVAFLERRDDVGFVYGYADVIDDEGRLTGKRIGVDISASANPLEHLLRSNDIVGPAIMFRRRCIDEAGAFDDSLIYSDWEYWFRLLAHWQIGFIDRPLVKYRVHGYNTSVGIPARTHLGYTLAVMSALRRKAPLIGGAVNAPPFLALLDLRLAHLFFHVGEEGEAARSLASAFSTHPALREDVARLAAWLHDARGETYDERPGGADGSDFSRWALSRLAPVAGETFTRRLGRDVKARGLAAAAYENYRTDLRRAGSLALDCLRADPRYARDRMLMTILFESLLGEKLATPLRGFKRRLLGSK
jgi:glycosyltransferase involved in cell wall biosynthesis